ncbi:m7GpppX diphosphatase [Stomoxys calcitrans]|uniref:m7GpppX diphosphatase n=1 Tax=Stomoxys calcitrans TaxID=35570 RepID=UPI0027E2ABB6|nr:m7GpppX diphosphatase [Stomoxys calcitrans]
MSEISEQTTAKNGKLEEKQCNENSEITTSIEEKTPTKQATASYDLNKFRLHRILNNNTRNKSIALLGRFPDVSENDQAIIVLEKQSFQESDVATSSDNSNGVAKEDVVVNLAAASYFNNDLKVQTEFINNIYGNYRCSPPSELNGVKATVVYPATDKHVEKYSICQKYVINETPEYYKDITLPYITSSQFSLEWVYNILEHKQETERIIFEDPDPDNGFILLPDLKWDGHNLQNLYVLVITHKHGLKSLRDLNSSHLPLLHNIRTKAAEAIEKRYGLTASQLRMYFHYQPSFYHLHVHINPLRNDAPGIYCEKSHMLDTVINNLELLPDYYEKASLPFVLYDGNKLLELYESKNVLRKAAKRLLTEDDVEPKAEKMILDDCDNVNIVPEESTESQAVREL